jgi:hypothetical protein
MSLQVNSHSLEAKMSFFAIRDIVCSEVVTTFSSFRFSELSQPI